MPWKLDENGAFVVDENKNPIWQWQPDGSEDKVVDYPAMHESLKKANHEAATRKDALRKLETKFKPLAEIDDVGAWYDEAVKAMDMAKNAPDKDKAIEEQVKARVEAATKPLNEKLMAREKELADAAKKLDRLAIEDALNNMPYMAKIAAKDSVRDLYRLRLAVNEDGVVYVKDAKGEPLYGENGLASPNEGLVAFVNSHPDKLLWTDGNNNSGTGASPGNVGTVGVVSTLKQLKTPADKVKYISEHGLEKFKQLPAE